MKHANKLSKTHPATIDIGPQIRAMMDEGKYAEAVLILEKIGRKDHSSLKQLAICQHHMGNHERAHQNFLLARSMAPTDVTLLDWLGDTCWKWGKREQAIGYGEKCLELKAKLQSGIKGTPPPRHSPPTFATNPSLNIIAFTLFGGNLRYCETAILNVDHASQIFPSWSCRFYVNDSVPQIVLQRLERAGASIFTVSEEINATMSPLMWRFMVADDVSIDRYLVRDADSLLSVREKVAVDAWIKSDRWFHNMRDHPRHSELILAGMWGGCRGGLSEIQRLAQDFCSAHAFHEFNIDQQFLRAYVWPTLRQSVLTHDGVFSFDESIPFPTHPAVEIVSYFHVGCNVGDGSIRGEVQPGDQRREAGWEIIDENGQLICQYLTPIKNGKWESGIPMPYLEKLKTGKWKLKIIS